MAAPRRLIQVALFTWKPGTTDRQIAELSDRLAALPGLIPEIRSYRFGRDAGLGEGNFDFAVVAEFDSAEAYGVYAGHPAHVDVITGLIRPMRDQRSAVQFEPEGG
jgi:hypothetical protein